MQINIHEVRALDRLLWDYSSESTAAMNFQFAVL